MSWKLNGPSLQRLILNAGIEEDRQRDAKGKLSPDAKKKVVAFIRRAFSDKRQFNLWSDDDRGTITNTLIHHFPYVKKTDINDFYRVNRSLWLYGREVFDAADFVSMYFWKHGLDATPRGIYNSKVPVPAYDPADPQKSLHAIVRAIDEESPGVRPLLNAMFEEHNRMHLNVGGGFGAITASVNKHLESLRSKHRATVAANIAYRGKIDLEAFVHVVDTCFPATPMLSRKAVVAVLYHTIWQTHRRMAGMPVIDPMMPILYSAQGAAKSLFWDQFFSVLAAAYDHSNFKILMNVYTLDLLRENFVLKVDELAGIEQVNIDEVKDLLDKAEVRRRAAHAQTFETVRVPVFVGTTNQPLNQKIDDVTGNRRMIVVGMRQIDPQAVLKLETEGWFLRMWQSVDPASPSLIRDPGVWKEVQAAQNTYRRQSEPEEWGRGVGAKAPAGYAMTSDIAFATFIKWRNNQKRSASNISMRYFENDFARCCQSFADFPWSVSGNLYTRRAPL